MKTNLTDAQHTQTVVENEQGGNDLYQCERWLNHSTWCKKYCGKCNMGGKS